jgi:phosphonate transport system ATP-binding protein
MPQIELSDVKKTFDGRLTALNGVSLAVNAGELVAILGPSGSGKSTLLRCINGLETPTSGNVKINGIPVTKKTLRLVRREVGMIFQRANLVPRTGVMSNVLIGRLGYRSWFTSLTGWFPAEDHALAQAALHEVRLLDRAWDRADKLSGGQQQRVGIARTVVQQAKVILADEPVASLDPETSIEVMNLLVRIAKKHEATLIVNLHQVDLAKTFAQRIIGLRQGKLVFDKSATYLSDWDLEQLYAGLADVKGPRPEEAGEILA